jgi:hypothetical protein
MQCGNNLKQVGLGLQNYHDVFNSLPYGARSRLADGANGSTSWGPSWYVGILPFCEQKNLSDLIEQRGVRQGRYDQISNTNTAFVGQAAHNQKIPWMLCPSSPLPQTDTNSRAVLTVPSYVGIAGARVVNTSNPQGNLSGATGEQRFNETRVRTGPRGGQWSGGGLLPINESLSMAACIDGTSNTMIVSEISDWYYRNGSATTIGIRARVDGSATGTPGVGGRWFVGTDRRFTASGTTGTFGANQVYNLTTVSHFNANSQAVYLGFDGRRLNIYNAQGVGQDRAPNHPLLSAHPNVVLSVFMDGHTQSITKTTHPAIVKRLGTRDDGQMVSNF